MQEQQTVTCHAVVADPPCAPVDAAASLVTVGYFSEAH